MFIITFHYFKLKNIKSGLLLGIKFKDSILSHILLNFKEELKKEDFFVCGNTWGKIRAMINDQGQKIDSAQPATPVEILGMNKSAFSGDDFIVVESEEKAKEINDYRIQHSKSKQAPLISVNKDFKFEETIASCVDIFFFMN